MTSRDSAPASIQADIATVPTVISGLSVPPPGSCASHRADRAAAAFSDFELLMLAGNNATRQNPSSSHFQHHQVARFSRDLRRQLTCLFQGTARDHAVPAATKRFIDEAAKALVSVGVGGSNGGAVTGVMGDANRAYLKYIQEAWERDGHCEAQVANVLLQLYGEMASYEAPMSVGRFGHVLAKQNGWFLRTPLLHATGQQAAMVCCEGGLGTLFEVYAPLTNKQLRNRGPVGPFDSRVLDTQMIFASSRTGFGETFWSPTMEMLDEIEACGVGRVSHFWAWSFAIDDVEGRETCVKLLSYIYQEAKQIMASEGQTPNLPSYSREEVQVQAKALANLQRAGFGPRRCLEGQSPFLALLDNIVAAHRVLYHRRNFMELRREQGVDDSIRYLSGVLDHAQEERSQTLRVIERLSSRPAIYLIGSAKLGSEESLHSEELEHFSREAIRQAVEHGVSIVIDGKGTEGMPARWSRIWADEMINYQSTRGVCSKSELVRVQLAYRGEEEPAREFAPGIQETVLPSVLTIEVRTALAGSIGGKRAVVLAPDGPGLSPFTQLLLDRQLAGSIDGCYQGREHRPEIKVLNVPGKEGRRPFYDPFLKQLQVMEAGRTINPSDYDAAWFDRLDHPESSARELIASLFR